MQFPQSAPLTPGKSKSLTWLMRTSHFSVSSQTRATKSTRNGITLDLRPTAPPSGMEQHPGWDSGDYTGQINQACPQGSKPIIIAILER